MAWSNNDPVYAQITRLKMKFKSSFYADDPLLYVSNPKESIPVIQVFLKKDTAHSQAIK